MAAFARDRGGVGGAGQYAVISTESEQPLLPNGACNYRELNYGARAPVCGCKRFWLNGSNLGSQGQREFCFCGHHACFHHPGQPQPRGPASATVSAIPEHVTATQNVRARNTPEGYYAVHQAGAGAQSKADSGLGIHQNVPSQSQSINTRLWEGLNGFARNQSDGAGSDTTSKLPSTAVPSINGDAAESRRLMGPPLNIPSTSLARAGYDDCVGSETEAATPSVAGTPDLQAFGPSLQPRFPPGPLFVPQPPAQAPSPPLQQHQSANESSLRQLHSREVEEKLQIYGRRLDALESMSFSHLPPEEVQDKFENHDVRLLDLEQWRDERDKERERDHALESEREHKRAGHSPDPPKVSSSKRRRLLPNESMSFDSDGSFDSTAAMHTEAAVLATVATNLELEPRFEALESRVWDLENSKLPSYTHPWDVQVVLLPWGRSLKGVWFTSSEATQQSQRSTLHDAEEWTGPQLAPTTSFHSTASTAWTTESIEAWAEDAQDWLSPKACGPSGTVYQRLASRGLVRDITLSSSNSKHILDIVCSAFLKVLPSDSSANTELLKQFQGLREPFLPLRKARKSSRLRFLSPAEMITSAAWTAELLESSAFMKCNDGQRRLYITTPRAYLQTDEGWTWKSLRQLPARDASGGLQADTVSRGVAIEACWSYNDKLDYVPSLHSSFGSHASRKSHREIVEQPNDLPHPMSPLSDARTLRQRTVSLPTSEKAAVATKRRAASHEAAEAAPTTSSVADVTAYKRPRLSISPEAERRGVGFTPRLSREPPSPFNSSVHMVDSRSQDAAGSSRTMPRGTTPFAYATPHSNSHFVGLVDLTSCGDNDTEIGTDLAGGVSEQGDEEWHGVGDGHDAVSEHGSGDESMRGDEEEYEEEEEEEGSPLNDTDVDEEEGLTIYER